MCINHYRILQRAHRKKTVDINCVDSLGRGALTIAIDAEHLEMVELLVIMSVETKDALLIAINAEFVEAVELLLEVGKCVCFCVFFLFVTLHACLFACFFACGFFFSQAFIAFNISIHVYSLNNRTAISYSLKTKIIFSFSFFSSVHSFFCCLMCCNENCII